MALLSNAKPIMQLGYMVTKFDALCRECGCAVTVEIEIQLTAIFGDGDIEPDFISTEGVVRCEACHSGILYELDENGLDMIYNEYESRFYTVLDRQELIDTAIGLAMQ